MYLNRKTPHEIEHPHWYIKFNTIIIGNIYYETSYNKGLKTNVKVGRLTVCGLHLVSKKEICIFNSLEYVASMLIMNQSTLTSVQWTRILTDAHDGGICMIYTT